MYIAILGRQPELGFAELQRIYKDKVTRVSKEACLLDIDYVNIDRLGGTVKLAKLFLRTNNNNWHQASETIKNNLIEELKDQDRKITLGISAYDLKLNNKDINTLHFSTVEEVTDYLKANKHKNEVILFKASRSMKLETIINDIK